MSNIPGGCRGPAAQFRKLTPPVFARPRLRKNGGRHPPPGQAGEPADRRTADRRTATRTRVVVSTIDLATRGRKGRGQILARDDGRVRPDHAALDGMILAKDDPFWHSRTPPWDFNCRCDIEDADEDEAAEAGTGQAVTEENPDGSQSAKIVNPATGAAREILPPASGFVFRADEAFGTLQMSRIRNVPMRGAVMQRLRALARSTQARFNCTMKDALEGPALANARMDTAGRLIDDAAAAVRAGKPVPDAEAQIGRLSAELNAALGLDADAVKLGGGKVGRKTSAYGLQHQLKNHEEQLLDGEMAAALEETLFSTKGARAMVGFTGGNMYLTIGNEVTTAVTTLYRRANEWHVASAARRGEDYLMWKGGMYK